MKIDPELGARLNNTKYIVIIHYENGSYSLEECDFIGRVMDLLEKEHSGMTGIIRVEAFAKIT